MHITATNHVLHQRRTEQDFHGSGPLAIDCLDEPLRDEGAQVQ
jgi:hypothetical protein